MEYNFSQDLKSIREILGISQEELAKELGVQQITLSRNESGVTNPSEQLLEMVYEYAFKNNIKINRLKEMLCRDNLPINHKQLFHGAKSEIKGEIDVFYGRDNNDFGKGFYTGENYEQAVSFVSGFDKSSAYIIDFNPEGLMSKEYKVNQEWMMTIAYYRGALDEYKNHPRIKKIIEESRECDYIVAPIADNRMFQIINSFINGEITDEQCKHCLAATNLGNQYVFISEKAVSHIKLLERCYVSQSERDYYKNLRTEEAKLGDDKVKLARRTYRGQGKYIDEILE